MAAVALTSALTFYERAPRETAAKVETFDGGRGVEETRVRLTPGESQFVRYIWCGWDADAGLKSSGDAQFERLAASPHLLEDADGAERAAALGERRLARAVEAEWARWRLAWESDHTNRTMTAKASGAGTHYRGDAYYPTERFCDRMIHGYARTDHGVGVRAAWRALRRMADRRSPSLVVLHALYGERMPGLPSVPIWDATDRDSRRLYAEYVRVVRFVDGVGSAAELEARVRIDKHRRPGETDKGFKERTDAAAAVRWQFVHHLGQACEEIIEQATVDYRQSWREVA